MAMAEGRVLRKTRHHVIHERNLWHVDVYHAELAGLMTAEIEKPSLSEVNAVVLPDWLGKELTDYPSMSNRALALNRTYPRSLA